MDVMHEVARLRGVRTHRREAEDGEKMSLIQPFDIGGGAWVLRFCYSSVYRTALFDLCTCIFVYFE